MLGYIELMSKNKTISTKEMLRAIKLLRKYSIVPVKGMLAYSNDKGEFVPMKTMEISANPNP